MTFSATAAVLRQQGGPFAIETLSIDGPRDDEVLVRIVATGICHTDQEAVLGHYPPPAPVVFGHEGAGIVEAVGAGISHVKPGDHVVLTYPSCGVCQHCDAGQPVKCDQVIPLSISGARPDGAPTLRDARGDVVHGSFFGQSSFASRAIARATNVVPIRKDAPLELMGPFGCGIQTGAGTVLNSLKPEAGASIAIFGAGAVGLAATMAAKIAGCGRIIVIDRVPARLKLAMELGATETVEASQDVAGSIGQVTFSIDASGAPQAIETAIQVLEPHGKCALLGVSKPGTRISFDHNHLLGCREIIGVMQGDAEPQTFIPRLVDLYMDGRLPVDRLVQFFELADIQAAFAGSASGEVIKPVLRMPAD